MHTRYKILENKDYLYEQYVVKKFSTVKIAKDIGCDPGAVKYRLRKYNIPVRNISESHLTGFVFNGDREILYGSLLGDGSLINHGKTDKALACFSKANVNYDHLWYVGKAIINEDPTTRIREQHPRAKGKTYKSFKFVTYMCQEFLDEYKKWYPNRTKMVPTELKLTPKIVLHWFLDDGHSCWKHKGYGSVNVGFSTESFSKKDCEILSDQLCNYGINSYLSKSHGGYGYKVSVRGSYVEKFFDFIGECPKEIGSMRYKWKIPQRKIYILKK